jgi:acyl-CoA dehydrogenase
MDFDFSSDALLLRDMLRRFVEDEAKPMEMKYFSTRTLEETERARLRTVIEQMGLWGITVPEKFGGGGLDMVTACLLHEELGKTFLPIDLGDVPPLLYACGGDQVENFLNPALAGKRRAILAAREPDAFRLEEWKTTATSDDSIYILNGKKLLPGIPTTQDFYIVMAKAPAGFSAFMLEQDHPGLSVVMNGSVVLQLDQCHTLNGSLLGECGQALKLGAEETPGACIQLGARYVGLAQRLLDMSIEYAKSWMALGALLKERPSIQHMLAEMQVQIESTRWLIYHAAWLADKHGPSHPVAAEVRLSTGEMLKRATGLVTLIYGGPGPSPEVEIHYYVRSTVPMEVLELGLEYARKMIATSLLAAGEGG